MKENMEAIFTTTGPTPVKQETIVVSLNPEIMVDGFASAVVREAQRKAPLVFANEPITSEEMVTLCRGILKLRVDSVNDENINWRKMKLINIPDFIQMSISMVGEVIIKESGIRLIPQMDGEVDIDEMIAISNKLEAYSDYIHMQKDAFPRAKEGNIDVMSTALINDYVRSLRTATHPADTYVAAFLGFKLQEETTFQILYRINYDDIEYVSSSINSSWRRLI